MRLRRLLLRILGYTLLATLSLLLVAFLVTQIQQHIFRHRAERLLADFHTIHLRETTWSEAQTLMQRWQKYGHADGPCNASTCGYATVLQDPIWGFDEHGSEWVYSALSTLQLLRLYEHLGSKSPRFIVDFIVQDGHIVRASASLMISVAPRNGDEFGYGLGAGARALSSLNGNIRRHKEHVSIFGDDDQLAQHPDYKAGRPGGCKICELGLITYTPYLAQAEVNRLTSFNLNCITNFYACTDPADILPALKPFQLYPQESPTPEPPEHPCSTSVRALGRDAEDVLEVEVQSVTKQVDPESYPDNTLHESASVKVLRVLKTSYGDVFPSTFQVQPYTLFRQPESPVSEHTKPGDRHYLLINSRDDAPNFYRAIHLQKCAVLPHTPETLADLQTGIAQNDHLTRSELVNFHR